MLQRTPGWVADVWLPLRRADDIRLTFSQGSSPWGSDLHRQLWPTSRRYYSQGLQIREMCDVYFPMGARAGARADVRTAIAITRMPITDTNGLVFPGRRLMLFGTIGIVNVVPLTPPFLRALNIRLQFLRKGLNRLRVQVIATLEFMHQVVCREPLAITTGHVRSHHVAPAAPRLVSQISTLLCRFLIHGEGH
jgi:hypothetical protein